VSDAQQPVQRRNQKTTADQAVHHGLVWLTVAQKLRMPIPVDSCSGFPYLCRGRPRFPCLMRTPQRPTCTPLLSAAPALLRLRGGPPRRQSRRRPLQLDRRLPSALHWEISSAPSGRPSHPCTLGGGHPLLAHPEADRALLQRLDASIGLSFPVRSDPSMEMDRPSCRSRQPHRRLRAAQPRQP